MKEKDTRRAAKFSADTTMAIESVQQENQWTKAMSFSQIAEVLVRDGLRVRRIANQKKGK